MSDNITSISGGKPTVKKGYITVNVLGPDGVITEVYHRRGASLDKIYSVTEEREGGGVVVTVYHGDHDEFVITGPLLIMVELGEQLPEQTEIGDGDS